MKNYLGAVFERDEKCKKSLIGMPEGKKHLEDPDVDVKILGKGKAVPLQAWSGPEGSRKLRFPDFMTMAQEGGKVVSLTHRPHLT